MGRSEVHVLLGGPQGAGLETSAYILTTALARSRYGVLSNREYYSNIVGRHSYIHLRASSRKIPLSLSYPVQAVAAMDAETVFTHYADLEGGGFLVYDTGNSRTRLLQVASMEQELKNQLKREYEELGVGERVEDVASWLESARDVRVVGISYSAVLVALAEKFGLSRSEAQRFKSSIVVGALAGLMNLDGDSIRYALEKRFGRRPKLVEINHYLISQIAGEVRQEHGSPMELEPSRLDYGEFLVVSGNDAVAMGKTVGGVRYQSYYPITPAADESVFLESHESLKVDGVELGSIIVLQTEDEIAAIGSAIGAALTGARSATATSGPGFDLMVEGLGWAGHNETPVVITYYQRGGPSTGLPTRGSQSDLLYSLVASHGEFPRIILASGDHLEAFYDSILAFNLAEKYQMPVIHLLDKFLANSITTMPTPDWSNIRIERGETLFEADKRPWKRFDKSSPISPRPVLGSGAITWYTGDEHDEWGHIVENPRNRLEMYEKRWKKLEIADREIPEEERAVLHGGGEDFLLVGWGFVKGVCLEAIEALRGEGLDGSFLQLRMFQPFPSRLVSEVIGRFPRDRVISVENNITGQAAKIISMYTGERIEKFILKWTGRPMYFMEVYRGILDIVKGGRDRVVLSYGQ